MLLLLSYCSVFKVQTWQILLHCGGSRHWSFLCLLSCSQESMVGLRGLEPPTSRLSGVRSNHLSYKPMSVFGDGRRSFVFRRPLVEMRRIELLTPCLQGRCSPSWATPPYEQGIRIEIFSFPRLKVHNLSIAPSKLNNVKTYSPAADQDVI